MELSKKCINTHNDAVTHELKVKQLTAMAEQRLMGMKDAQSTAHHLRDKLDDMQHKLDDVFEHVEEVHHDKDDLIRWYCFQHGKVLDLKEELLNLRTELERQ